MSPYLPFLQAIRENPSDDGLRLVFADWLEENGEPERAEFLRVQFELSPMAWNDPRRTVLIRRERELLRQHRAAWLGPLAGLETTLRGIDRGPSRKSADAYFMFFRGLLHVRLGPDAHPSLEVLAAPEWDWVEEFGWHCGWQGADVLHFLTAPRLARCTSLTLRGNRSSRISGRELAELVRSPLLARITTLDLRGCPIGNTGAATLAASPHLAQLTVLDLIHTEIGDSGAAALAASPHLGQLTALHLRRNGIESGGSAAQALRERFGKAVYL